MEHVYDMINACMHSTFVSIYLQANSCEFMQIHAFMQSGLGDWYRFNELWIVKFICISITSQFLTSYRHWSVAIKWIYSQYYYTIYCRCILWGQILFIIWKTDKRLIPNELRISCLVGKSFVLIAADLLRLITGYYNQNRFIIFL